MTGIKDMNHPAFRAATARLRTRGYTVYSPHEVFGGRQGFTRAEYMRADFSLLLMAEIVVLLPGWEASAGARLEVTIAKELKLPIVTLSQMLEVL